MKKLLVAFLFSMLCVAFSVNFSYAFDYRIEDNFVGTGWDFAGNVPYFHTGSTGLAHDVIGTPSSNEVYWMDVNITGTMMRVDIRTDFVPHWNTASTPDVPIKYGDFFISTNGWTPDSEAWEYVFNVRDNKLYDIRNAQDHILMTDDAEMYNYHTRGSFRRDQEDWINSNGLTAIGTGNSWKSSADYYSISFDLAAMNLVGEVDFGFHWTMTCANDVIEGGMKATITPEPSTLLLFGAGLFGLLAVGRKQIKK